MKAEGTKRLKELEREDARLERAVANKELGVDALREVPRGIGEPVEATPGGPGAPGPPRPLAAAGVPGRRPVPLLGVPLPGRGRPGQGPADPAARLRQGASPLGVPAVLTPYCREGHEVNRKKIQRLWREEGRQGATGAAGTAPAG